MAAIPTNSNLIHSPLELQLPSSLSLSLMSTSSALSQLLALGIPRPKAHYALTEAAGNLDVAADWCYSPEGVEWTPQSLNSSTVGAPPPRNSPSPPPHSSYVSAPSPSARPPPHRLLSPGTRVRIVLKADQGTGRTVDGVVGELLTRGDHPRGVKVRLVDGRVGRVVAIV